MPESLTIATPPPPAGATPQTRAGDPPRAAAAAVGPGLAGRAAGAAPRIAVLIPCYNEEVAIPGVVRGFRAALPDAVIHVYDNNSRDRTREVARVAGAVVRREPLQGKGNVVRRMFADVEADIYVLVDGDGTYDAAAAPAMVRLLLEERLDMVTGVRVTPEADAAAAYRPGHRFGNLLLTGMVRLVFGDRITDMLSGYRVFSRRFVKSFPALAEGFETETEFTVHALQLKMPVGEVPTAYGERPTGSTSKLHTYTDGLRILRTIVNLAKGERPLAFFSAAAGALALLALAIFLPVLAEYLRTGLVPRLPTAVLSTGLALAALLAFACGLVLDTVTRGRKEAKRIAYLAVPAPDFDPDRVAGGLGDGAAAAEAAAR
jgi:glycosyltransferase involved in cell wall biosynthesis